MRIDLNFTDPLRSIPVTCTNTGWVEHDRRKLMIDTFPQEAKLLTSVLDNTDFYTAPASTKYHGAYIGGLFDHSMNVACVLKQLTSVGVCHQWESSSSPVIVGMLHDFTKVGKYQSGMDGVFTYNTKAMGFGGHGSDSVIKLQRHLNLSLEEILCIRYHMGAYETDDWEGFDRAIRMYPNVLWTHTADMYASKVMEAAI